MVKIVSWVGSGVLQQGLGSTGESLFKHCDSAEWQDK